jgi:hypothetical protein
MERFVASIPKVVTELGDTWVPASGPSSLDDNEAVSTLWWLLRPRAKYGTVEWRPGFPSLAPEQAADLATDVLALAAAIKDYFERHPKAQWHTKEQAERLYRHLATFDLVPPRPLFETDWWQLHDL